MGRMQYPIRVCNYLIASVGLNYPKEITTLRKCIPVPKCALTSDPESFQQKHTAVRASADHYMCSKSITEIQTDK